ncbi:LptA/OstA family protein [Bartonella tamiae]|uniref:Lipopolysaccharide transport periplasmic protein LptA n=1 Tax=Bartonella tamiae Th239 TaxID=1094558 RepID=J0ZQU0_9HYPH|nr:LptA/OstA family protein [Bartonella tamiae]EJF91038.1 lipopolysaccharide transport periplasmic protein LptA [Bartonella tamiae Th239]EJF93297.1 lipopolysaccharide transport periplasmic protein LptA [Bartonella tamiae Th307]
MALKHLHYKLRTFIVMTMACFGAFGANAHAQQTDFGVNLSGGKEPVELNADNLEMRDKEGIAIFTGNVSVVQGDRVLRTSKLIVHYAQNDKDGNNAQQASASNGGGLGSTGVEKMEASGKVYIKTATQVATGDAGTFDGPANQMVLTGQPVTLIDGDNVVTGCKLTAHMDTGKAFLESCKSTGQKGRVSIIMNRNEQNGN